MFSSGSRRFRLSDRCLYALRRLDWVVLPVLLSCGLILIGAPVWALDPRGTLDPPADAAPPGWFLARWSRLPTGASDLQADTGCKELIRDGDFATDRGWILGASPRPARLAYPPRYAATPIMHLGLPPAEAAQAVSSYSSIWQAITLPADRVGILHWSWQLHTQEEMTATPAPDEDRQQFLLLDAEGRLLEVIASTRLRQHAWTTQTHDLSPYAGRTVRLYFNAYNDGDTRVTSMWLDDISVQACASSTLGGKPRANGPADTPVLAWRPDPATSPSTTGFLTWGLGLCFSLLLIVLGLWERSQSIR